MSDKLDLPAELQHLLEKRAQSERRGNQRRKAGASSASIGADKRKRVDRRKKPRRADKTNS
jgi:hypothetical protein